MGCSIAFAINFELQQTAAASLLRLIAVGKGFGCIMVVNARKR